MATRGKIMAKRAPIHPGEILKAEFLDELKLTPYALAKALSVPTNRITMIVIGERSISAETALRLSRYFGTTAEFWLNLQMHYDLQRVPTERIKREIEPLAETA
jgi:addiction module HigA family antidote